jgi:hypothetical protein
MNDRDVVEAFVSHLASHGHPGLKVDRRPDEENRGSPDIDAIAGRFAIEHTSIDTIPNQRRDSDWFMRAVGDIERELDVSEARLNITIEYDAVTLGQDWTAVRAAFKGWVVGAAPHLLDGRHVVEASAAIPFRLHVVKSSARRPGVFFGRFAPVDATLSARIRASFDRKSEKLAKYRAPGVVTVLLVESSDIAMMNDAVMLDGIRAAFPAGPPHGVDQVWFADTSIEGALEFRDFTPELRAPAV